MNEEIDTKFRIAFFEPEMAGHQPEYIRHICNYAIEKALDIEAIFIVHPNFLQSFPDIAVNIGNQSNPRILFLPLQRKEFIACMHHSLAVRSFLRWRILLGYMKRVGAQHGCILYLDHVQLPLALQCKPKMQAPISGILFRPSVHYNGLSRSRLGLTEILVTIRKRLLYYGLMKNTCLSVVFSLDPYFPVYAQNHLGKTKKSVALPDPHNVVKPNIIEPNEFVSSIRKAAENRKVFLLFGALQGRKGIIKTLEALKYIEEHIQRKIAIVFAGQVDHSIKNQFVSTFNAVSSLYKQCLLYNEDRFLSDTELNQIISLSHAILAPYQRFPGSSGLLISAAAANIPVITQDYGLLGAYTREFGLGLAIDTTKPEEIARAITSLVNDERDELYSKEGMKSFLSGRTPEDFAKTIFGNIMKSCK